MSKKNQQDNILSQIKFNSINNNAVSSSGSNNKTTASATNTISTPIPEEKSEGGTIYVDYKEELSIQDRNKLSNQTIYHHMHTNTPITPAFDSDITEDFPELSLDATTGQQYTVIYAEQNIAEQEINEEKDDMDDYDIYDFNDETNPKKEWQNKLAKLEEEIKTENNRPSPSVKKAHSTQVQTKQQDSCCIIL